MHPFARASHGQLNDVRSGGSRAGQRARHHFRSSDGDACFAFGRRERRRGDGGTGGEGGGAQSALEGVQVSLLLLFLKIRRNRESPSAISSFSLDRCVYSLRLGGSNDYAPRHSFIKFRYHQAGCSRQPLLSPPHAAA
jgi:hypothetical protein